MSLSNASSSNDPLPNSSLKQLCNLWLPHVLSLNNKSLTTGCFLVGLNMQNESLEVEILSNYRLLSNLLFHEKLFEKVVHIQLTSYLEKNDLLSIICSQSTVINTLKKALF